MKKYKIQDREAGNIIEENLTFEQAQEMVLAFVKADKKEGNYTPEFYEIKEMETNITPGKWEVSRETNGLYVHAKNPNDNFNDAICLIYEGINSHAPEAEANAEAIASLPDITRENDELKARCETYKKDYDSMVAEVLRLSGENSELLEALKSARDVLAMASLIDKTATCGNESDKIDSILYKYAPNKL